MLSVNKWIAYGLPILTCSCPCMPACILLFISALFLGRLSAYTSFGIACSNKINGTCSCPGMLACIYIPLIHHLLTSRQCFLLYITPDVQVLSCTSFFECLHHLLFSNTSTVCGVNLVRIRCKIGHPHTLVETSGSPAAVVTSTL